jgi:site-specific recombinase XerC
MLFDWLVTSHVLDVDPVHAVRGPKTRTALKPKNRD